MAVDDEVIVSGFDRWSKVAGPTHRGGQEVSRVVGAVGGVGVVTGGWRCCGAYAEGGGGMAMA